MLVPLFGAGVLIGEKKFGNYPGVGKHKLAVENGP